MDLNKVLEWFAETNPDAEENARKARELFDTSEQGDSDALAKLVNEMGPMLPYLSSEQTPVEDDFGVGDESLGGFKFDEPETEPVLGNVLPMGGRGVDIEPEGLSPYGKQFDAKRRRPVIIHNHIGDEGWSESQHPRGQPGNPGQFAPKGGGGSSSSSKALTAHKEKTKKVLSKPVLMNANYRADVQKLIKEAEEYGLNTAPLKQKIVDSLKLKQADFIKKGDLAAAAKIGARLKKWGYGETETPKPVPQQQQSPEPQSKYPAELLEKAKGTGKISIPNNASYAVVELVQQFNSKYKDKKLTTTAKLEKKIDDYTEILQTQAIHEQLLAEKKKQAEEEQEEALKGVMKDLNINQEEATAFVGLAKMLGGSQSDLIAKFKYDEADAKKYDYPISGFEAAVIKNYSDKGYIAINAALRKGSKSEQQHVYVKLLTSALLKMPRHSGTVYRGAVIPASVQSQYKVGQIIEERGFTSTSTDPKWADTLTGYVITAKGRRAADIKKLSHYSYENEVLFAARTFFKVTKIEGEPGGKMKIHMEEWD